MSFWVKEGHQIITFSLDIIAGWGNFFLKSVTSLKAKYSIAHFCRQKPARDKGGFSLVTFLSWCVSFHCDPLNHFSSSNCTWCESSLRHGGCTGRRSTGSVIWVRSYSQTIISKMMPLQVQYVTCATAKYFTDVKEEQAFTGAVREQTSKKYIKQLMS